MMKLGRRVNSFLIRFGYKIAILNRKSKRTFPEEQLLKALVELNGLYKTFVFNKELTVDEESLELLSNSVYTKFGTGFYIINYLRESLDREGDVCEFGVAQGTLSALLAHEIKDTNKSLWLFDSFEGFPEPSETDILIRDIMNAGSIGAYKGMMSFPEEEVKSRLSDINFPPERIRIVPGFIEKTIKGPRLPQAVCFAYVDFNFYEPILIALNFLDTVLLEGGFIIIDDYDDFLKGVKSAVDEFYDSRREKYTLKFPVKPAGKFCILCKNN
jgi:hypothetical protein